MCIRDRCEIPYVNKRYASKDDWFGVDKPALDTPFPNLPYLKDGDKIITESSAIILHIILRSGKLELLGKTVDDKVLVVQLRGVIMDARVPLFREPTNYIEVTRKIIEDHCKTSLKKLSTHLGDKQYLVGDYITFADLYMIEFLEHLLGIDAEVLKEFPNLDGLHKRYLEIPQINSYRVSDRFLAKPILNKFV
eukprot:TRINITY_DN11036_c0_g1_i1.p1 TRINITY_DN11036_c0_g1~~TRINITY_DN11036_c0_g1_i1.p1  ORF type:complete len:213 (+),score=72.48 TRINITY_DN11036_c0_g1_i1:61-639(+)